MGKNMYAEHVDDELEDFNPSCMWGIMHALDYHHWRYSVKRMLHHRKHQGRHAKSHGSPKRGAPDHASGEMQMLQHEEERASSANQNNKDSSPINKKSLKSRFKAFMSDQTHKEGNDKHRGSRFSSQSGLERTYSIHHREPSDHGFGEVCTDWEHPIILFPGEEDTGGNKLHDPTKSNVTEKPDAGGEKFNKSSNKDASKEKLKAPTDVLEIFKINKELFLEILKNADDGIKRFSRGSLASKAKSRLTKSGSVPAGDLSQRRNLGPSQLKHKQSEIWSGPPGEKYPMDVLKYSKNFLSRSVPSAGNSSGASLGRALSLVLQSRIESDKEGPRDFVMPLKESKQAIQFEGKKNKNETNSSLSVLGEISNGEESSTSGRDFAESSAEITMNGDGDKSSCISYQRDDIDYRNSTFSYRRSSSLNESIGKYASLFEKNSGKEVKLHSSKSLRLSNENEMRSGKSAPILFKRIRSLSQLDEFYSSLQNVVQAGGIFADWPITSVEETSSSTEGDTQGGESKPAGFSSSTKEYVTEKATQEPQHQSEMIEMIDRIDGIPLVGNAAELGASITDECSARLDDLPERVKFRESNSDRDEKTNNLEIADSRMAESCPISASENFFQDEASSFDEFQSTEGLESRCEHVDEDSSINLNDDGIGRASSTFNGSMPNLENIAIPDHMKTVEKNIPKKKGDTDLDYLKDLLERSGFAKNAFKWTWHSLDQPLSPSVFEEMEAYWHQELDCSKEDLWTCYHHQLLFELVNEELANLYDRSYTYYPKALSSSCQVRQFPVGNHFLEEIFSSIISLMSLKPEQMQSLDSIFDLDFKKNDGWMNLQLESEGVALELEDMIFDELLEELVRF